MNLVIIVIIVLLLAGGLGGYHGGWFSNPGMPLYGGGLVGILLVFLLLMLVLGRF